jgi:hypothetical protein
VADPLASRVDSLLVSLAASRAASRAATHQASPRRSRQIIPLPSLPLSLQRSPPRSRLPCFSW